MSEFRRRLLIKKNEVELKENEILAIYNVVSNETTRLLGNDFNISNVKKMNIDGLDVTPNKTYQFTKNGEVTIKIEMTQNLISLSSMFNDAQKLKYVDLRRVSPTNCYRLFRTCYSLQEVLIGDTSNTVDFFAMFFNCSRLRTIPQFDTSKGNNMSYMFYTCIGLQEIPLLDMSSLTNDLVGFCQNVNTIKLIHGFKNLNRNLSLSNSRELLPISVHNIIEYALGNFTFTLNSTAKTNWQNSEYYEADQAMATEKLITIQ